MISLPFIKKQKHLITYYLVWAPYIIAYILTNRFPIFEPAQLPLTWLDKNIPFIPFMLPIYVSYLFYTFYVVSRSSNDGEVNEIFYITHVQLVIALAFFIFLPVTYPRGDFLYDGNLTGFVNQLWLMFDGPNNCFPSLHTANCCLAIHCSKDKPKKWLFIGWGVLIIAGTLVCKQHYVIDVLAGFVVYAVSVPIARRWLIAHSIHR